MIPPRLVVAVLLLAGAVSAAPLPSPVRVVNTTAEPVPVQGEVTVGNTATSPVRVRNVDEAGASVFQTGLRLDFNQGDFAVVGSVPAAPDGMMLEIDFVSVHAQVPSGQKVRLIFFTGPIQHYFAPELVGTDVSVDNLILSQPTRMFTDSTLRVNATRFDGTANQGTGFVLIGITGRLVPIAP